ncbi:MAG: hypothetical protein C3F12_04455 [Candidatus Methylomirabilota bacterium]|nr:hypothetical protein [Candidatus Methylomirabilis sp.]NJD67797.1 hypothetical protein [candidate division NC10 bacterium]PWB47233.1 MAG: hypothetical protein C3F12_04455 [candidate division NC10 bacterium]
MSRPATGREGVKQAGLYPPDGLRVAVGRPDQQVLGHGNLIEVWETRPCDGQPVEQQTAGADDLRREAREVEVGQIVRVLPHGLLKRWGDCMADLAPSRFG